MILFDTGMGSCPEADAHYRPRRIGLPEALAAVGVRIFELIADPAQQPRWDGNDNLALRPAGSSRTRVTRTYDWTQLTDEKRFPRARATTADRLRVSLDRLAALAERP